MRAEGNWLPKNPNKKKNDDILLYSAPFIPSAKVIHQLSYVSKLERHNYLHFTESKLRHWAARAFASLRTLPRQS